MHFLRVVFLMWNKSEFGPLEAVKGYGGLEIKLGTEHKWVIIFTLRPYYHRRQSPFTHWWEVEWTPQPVETFGKQKDRVPPMAISLQFPGHPASRIVRVPIYLSRLALNSYTFLKRICCRYYRMCFFFLLIRVVRKTVVEEMRATN